jgi:peptidoglycan/LPS O-acetylase OafA/YrhL
MIRLGDVAQGHDNNLNLIRFGAALAVLVSHAWPISQGIGVTEPLFDSVGHSLGSIAVYIFFAISGFLITASFERSRTPSEFLLARATRIYPGLIVSVLFVAFVLGPIATALPVATFLTSTDTWRFLVANILLVSPQYTLPGVFEETPYPAIVGSIWTLIHEIVCYLMVLAAGMMGLLRTKARMVLFLGLYGLTWVAALAFPDLFPTRLLRFQGLSLPFVFGMAGWIWRDRIPLTLWGAIALGGLWFVLRATPVAYPAFIGFVAYSTACLAYIPGGSLRAYNRLGDYSYGVYIYAFPLQGMVAWLFGSTSVALHIALAVPPVLLVSVLSWHLIEKPALDWLKRRRGRRDTMQTTFEAAQIRK